MGMPLELSVVVVAVGTCIAIYLISKRKRSAAVRRLADQLGFAYLGSILPGSLDLRGTPIDALSSVWNAIDGSRQGLRVIAFDCRIGTGKGSWRRTVIAVQTIDNVFGGHDSELQVDHSGAWSILYAPKSLRLIPLGLMPVPELTAQIESLRKPLPFKAHL